ncbi:MAG: prolyl oligopeptidase family serine peptidase [Cyclobacteriaceae bacterium]|nr:S9 family peptidase [Cyclobacteriaceae bacterium]MCH8516901.1 prolyl oligopeptidase family serine peptidase [Cyclobacteriaceae bacterium]
MRISILLLLCFATGVVMAQKRPITVADYDSLHAAKQFNFSEKEGYLWFTEYPQVGDEKVILRDMKAKDTTHFNRSYRPFVTGNELYFGATLKIASDSLRALKLKGKKKDDLPKDQLLIYDLKSYERDTFENVLSVKHTPKNLDIIAFTQETPKEKKKEEEKKEEPKGGETEEVEIVEEEKRKEEKQEEKKEEDKKKKKKKKLEGKHLTVFSKDSVSKFEYVLEYSIAEERPFVLFISEKVDSISTPAVNVYNANTGQLQLLDSGAVAYKNLSFSTKSNRLAFLATEDTVKGEEEYRLLSFSLEKNTWKKQDEIGPRLELNGHTYTLSEHARLDFYQSESHLFYGLRDTLVKFEYEKDTSILDEEKVKIDIWSWHDDEIATVQLNNVEAKKKQFYRASYNFKSKQSLLLTENLEHSLSEPRDFEHPMAFLSDVLPYRRSMLYDFQYPQDLYSVNMLTGERKLIEKEIVARVASSHAGNALAYYTLTDSSWNVYSFKQNKKYNYMLPDGLSFANELHDTPNLPGNYGYAGFTEKDEHFIVYDRYDIYALSSTKNELKSLTQGKGREDKKSIRYQRIGDYKDPIDLRKKWMVSLFDDESKVQTLHAFDPKKGELEGNALMAGVGLHGVATSSLSGDWMVTSFQNFQQAPRYDLYEGNQRLETLLDLQPQYEKFLWGSVEKVTWRSLQGDPLEGLLYLPEGEHAKESLPLMVYFYDRSSNTLHSFKTPGPSASIINIAHFVSNGYAVFVPDIIYQTGFPGKGAYDCIIPGVQEVLKNETINPAKMAIQGQSWGGYQVSYLITQTNMFAAAGAGAPVANMTSAYGGIRWGSGYARVFQYEQGQSRIGANLWEAPMRYLENSPLFYADKVQTPLLIMHNDKDGAVPWYQGIEFFLALKRNDSPVWMLNYNGEDHNLIQRKNRVDLSLRLSAFFDHYLKDEPMPIWMEKGIPATLKGRSMGHGEKY